MKKIISLFQRNYDTDRLVRDEVVSGAEWVLAGKGIATRKFDGTCCLIQDGALFKRYDVKKGRISPTGFIPAQDPDEVTGHWPGWVPVGDGPEDRWHREALSYGRHTSRGVGFPDGTYELCGPKVRGNPEGLDQHVLIRHGCEILLHAPRNFEGIRSYLAPGRFEGIVWHHDDGRMVKIKARDFGFKRRSMW